MGDICMEHNTRQMHTTLRNEPENAWMTTATHYEHQQRISN